MADLINIGICVSDIPKERVRRAENGKCHINIVVAERREVDKYGNTHTVYLSQSKEERAERKDRIYVGQGKAVVFQPVSRPEDIDNLPPTQQDEDIPW